MYRTPLKLKLIKSGCTMEKSKYSQKLNEKKVKDLLSKYAIKHKKQHHLRIDFRLVILIFRALTKT